MAKIPDDPMQLNILIRLQSAKKGGRQNRVKRKLVGRDRLWELVNRGRFLKKFVHDNVVYIRRQEEDVSGFQIWKIVRPVSSNGKGCARYTGVNDLAFVVQVSQTFQNVFRQAQYKFERESWVAEFTLQTRNAVAKHFNYEANVLASETLECEFMQEMNDVFESVMNP